MVKWGIDTINVHQDFSPCLSICEHYYCTQRIVYYTSSPLFSIQPKLTYFMISSSTKNKQHRAIHCGLLPTSHLFPLHQISSLWTYTHCSKRHTSVLLAFLLAWFWWMVQSVNVCVCVCARTRLCVCLCEKWYVKLQKANYKQIQKRCQFKDFSIMTNFIHILIHSKEKHKQTYWISSM